LVQPAAGALTCFGEKIGLVRTFDEKMVIRQQGIVVRLLVPRIIKLSIRAATENQKERILSALNKWARQGSNL
jgi:hypothetical protein